METTWIPVTERLPEIDGDALFRCLVTVNAGVEKWVTEADYENAPARFLMAGGDWSAYFDAPHYSRRGMDYGEQPDAPLCRIVAWMPMPPPYTTAETEEA